ncbi:unnamed protein product [Absidia cylindrospora]
MDGQSMHTSHFASSHHIDVNNPWGNVGEHEAPHADIGRSFTSPNLQSLSLTSNTDYSTNTATMVLSGISLPDPYNKLFNETQRFGRVSLSALHKILERAQLSSLDIEKIIQMIVPTGSPYVTRPEFTATLALIYCVQNHLDLSLESLYQHRKVLGFPILTPAESSDPINHFDSSLPPITKSLYSINIPGLSPSSSSTSTVEAQRDPPTQKLNTKNWFKDIEEIKITIAPEREGLIFKHVNYIITSQQRSSIVLRRFNDFWWLMEILTCRYPFRMLPILPPKKFGGRDGTAFLEKRRKGLTRFINSVVRHPTLRDDPVVSKFLTEPLELATWRKHSPPSLVDEYKRKQHDIEDMMSIIPGDIEDRIQRRRTNVASSIDQYVNMCYIMERTIRRMDDQVSDYIRFSMSLNALAQSEQRYHASECQSCQRIVDGYENLAKHMQKDSGILDNQVSISAEGVLENLKFVRDLLVSFRELVDRKDKLMVDNSVALKKRLSSCKSKLTHQKGIPGKEHEVKRLVESIQSDEQELQELKRRRIFIHSNIWTEMTYLHKQQAFVSALYGSYVNEMMEFLKLRAENWQLLEDPVFEMPMDWDEYI